MGVQMQKTVRKVRTRPAAPSGNGQIADPRHDEDIARMAAAIAASRAAERHARIEDAAYFLAEKRGFQPGHESEDWMAAEAAIASQCAASGGLPDETSETRILS
jgi:hypothetical protein